METVGKRIEKVRLEKGLSKTQIWKSAGLTSGIYSQWLNGMALSGETLINVARVLGVNPEWLATGKGPKYLTGSLTDEKPNVKDIKYELNTVPKISWVQAGDVCETEDYYEPGSADEWLICPVKHGKRTFVLEVVGDSMNSGDMDGYIEGLDIFVDPDVEPKHGDDVIVRTPENKATFKRLQITDEGKYLLALNKTWPNRIIEVPEGTVICGVVIYSGKSRKK